jgi:peptide/nickel transport system substrate-binding protein
VVGCAGPGNPSGLTGGDSPASGQPAAPAPTAPRRVVAAIQGNPLGGYSRLDPNNSERGNQELGVLVHAGLTSTDTNGQLHARMAEAVPNVDNGMWKVNPDGTMETTFKIRNGAEWHDGTPLTSDDLLFTYRVVRDRELPVFRHRALNFVASVDAIDQQTVVVKWTVPYVLADTMFGDRDRLALPLPKHLLETAYNEDKAAFLQLPYWNVGWVGLGPYKIKEWERASHIIVTANDRYVLGRPKVDEIELKTIPDANSIMANLLAGSVDMTMGRSLSLDQIVQLRDRMPGAQIQTPLTSLMVLNPQMLNPSPAMIANTTFRKALMHAIDRQELADTIDYGLVPVAHGFVFPTLVEGREIEPALVRYEYDPRRAAQMIEGLGYTRASDGFYRDASGQQLRIEVRATQGEINPKTMAAASDFLQRSGIAMDQVIIPLQLVSDQQYRATFPGLIVNGGGGDADQLEYNHSREARLQETNWTGQNRSRYMNAELDALIDSYVATIPFGPRMDLARQIARHVTDNLPIMPLFFDTWPGAAAGRLVNVSASANNGMSTWNAHLWDVQ